MPLGWVAAAGAIVSAGTAAYNAYNQSSIQGDAQGMADTQFGEQQHFESMLENLFNDPTTTTKNLPGYQFNFNQGADAVAREMGAAGFGGSGNEAIALTQYGQGYAMNTFNQYASLLGNLSGLSTTSANSNLLNTSSGAGTQSFNQTGQLLASLGYTSGNSGLSLGNSGGTPNYASDAGSGGGGTVIDAGGGYNFTW